MKKCKYCGAKIPDDSLFCPKCGKSTSSDISLDDYVSDDAYHYVNEEESEKEPSFDEQKEETQNQEPSSVQKESSSSSYSNVFSILALVFGALGGWLGLLFGILTLCTSKVEKERKRAKIGIGLFCAWAVVTLILTVVYLMSALGANPL